MKNLFRGIRRYVTFTALAGAVAFTAAPATATDHSEHAVPGVLPAVAPVCATGIGIACVAGAAVLTCYFFYQ